MAVDHEIVALADDLRRAAEEYASGSSQHSSKAAKTDSSHGLGSREELLELAAKIQGRLASLSDFVEHHAKQSQYLACIRWLCHFGIVVLVPVDSPLLCEDVAVQTGVSISQLRSIARMAMTTSFMSEPEPEKLGHSSLSASFARDPSRVDWFLFVAEGTASSASKLVEATERFGTTSSLTETAYNIAKGSDLSYFDYLQTAPKLSKQFADYMRRVAQSDANSMRHVVAGFDWSSLRSGTVVDVGGSSGHASLAIASEYKDLQFIVQDLPAMLEKSASETAATDLASQGRLSFQSHDFFAEQPVKNAAAYLLRTIIHD